MTRLRDTPPPRRDFVQKGQPSIQRWTTIDDCAAMVVGRFLLLAPPPLRRFGCVIGRVRACVGERGERQLEREQCWQISVFFFRTAKIRMFFFLLKK